MGCILVRAGGAGAGAMGRSIKSSPERGAESVELDAGAATGEVGESSEEDNSMRGFVDGLGGRDVTRGAGVRTLGGAGQMASTSEPRRDGIDLTCGELEELV
ncbi:hypothetical protein FCV25MIE_15719 [Fagus crenata]